MNQFSRNVLVTFTGPIDLQVTWILFIPYFNFFFLIYFVFVVVLVAILWQQKIKNVWNTWLSLASSVECFPGLMNHLFQVLPLTLRYLYCNILLFLKFSLFLHSNVSDIYFCKPQIYTYFYEMWYVHGFSSVITVASCIPVSDVSKSKFSFWHIWGDCWSFGLWCNLVHAGPSGTVSSFAVFRQSLPHPSL